MAFDLSSAKPVESSGGFDLSTAQPVEGGAERGGETKRAPQYTPSPGAWDQALTGIKQGAGDALRGVTALPIAANDAVLRGVEMLGGPQLPGAGATIDKYVPRSPPGFGRAIRQGMAGSMLNPASGVRGLVAGGVGGAGAEGANQAGLPWWAQMLTGTAAGGAAGMAVPRPSIPKPPTVLDQTAAQSSKAGYTLPPSQVNPSPLNKALEGFSGKIQTRQSASTKNQTNTDQLVRKDLGLPADAPLTPDTLESIRGQAGRSYAAARAAIQSVAPDTIFQTAISNIGGTVAKAGSRFAPVVNSEPIEQLKKVLLAGPFSSSDAVDLVKQLRANAANGIHSADPQDRAVAQAQFKAAEAVDTLVERQLKAQGQDGIARDYRAARQRIAKTYDVQAALNPATGEVDARRLGTLAKKRTMSGGMKQAAAFGQAFPQAAQPTATVGSHPGFSPLDAYGVLSSGPEGLALLARGPVRSLITSPAYQQRFVQPPNRTQAIPGMPLIPALPAAAGAGAAVLGDQQ